MPTSFYRLVPWCVFALTSGAIGFFTVSTRVPAQTTAPPVAVPADAPVPAPVAATTPAPYIALKVRDLPDKRIDESSGMAASRRYPGCLWTHNDSGDSARLFLLDAQGKTLSEIIVRGASARDWEDMAIASDGQQNWVYVGDIGDNLEVHPGITIYRFSEPEIDVNNPPAQLTVSCEKMTLTYPDAPRNTETLIAAPNGQLLIVTKSLDETLVFQTPEPFKAGEKQQLQKLGEIEMPEGFRKRMTTAGDISPDGKKLVVITYTQAYEWQLPGWKKDGAPQWSQIVKDKANVWNLPVAKQMEAVCYGLDSKKLFSTSEQLPAPLFEYTVKMEP